MYSLIFSVCLISDTSICKDHSVLTDFSSQKQCIAMAMPELAIWAGEHPNWQIKRWSCESLEERKVKI